MAKIQKLTKKRRNEIANSLFDEIFQEKKFKLNTQDLKEGIEIGSEKLGIPKDELKAFFKEKVDLMVSEMFSLKLQK